MDDNDYSRRIIVIDDKNEIHQDFIKSLGVGDEEIGVDDDFDDLDSEIFGESKDPKKAKRNVQYQVESAHQGLEGLSKIEAAQAEGNPFALAFVDVRMPPGIDGIETIRKIWEVAPETEIVLCTAYMDYSHDDIVRELGVTDRLLFLKKPFDSVAVRQMALTLTTKWNLNRELDRHLAGLQEQVDSKTQMLLESSKFVALGQMAGGVAHEINNPLTIIQGYCEGLTIQLAKPDRDEKKIIQYIETIQKGTFRISGIVKGLLSFSREAKQDPAKDENLCDLIDETLFFSSERFKLLDIRLEIDIPKELIVHCRATQLSQVLVNLLNNGADAISELSDKWMRIEATEEASHVVVAVTDSGPGIDLEAQKRLFDPFFSTKEVGKGTGLGLSVSKGILESHGGSLEIDNGSPNTRFVLRIPIVRSEKLAS